MTDPEQLRAALADSPFRDRADALAALAAPSNRAGVRRVAVDDLPLGASRLGGRPDVPADFVWPRCDGRPLTHLAQLALADLPPLPGAPLPSTGWLLFFLDVANESPYLPGPAGEPSWRVQFVASELRNLRRVAPPGPRTPHSEFLPFAMAFGAELTLPSYGSTLLDGLNLTATEGEAYEDLAFALLGPAPAVECGETGRLRRWLAGVEQRWRGDPVHRVLGHPEHFQIDPRIDWQRLAQHRSVTAEVDPALRVASRDWTLLLQLDAFREGPTWLWGDNGTLYFGIRPADLAARRFDAVQWTVECG